MSGTIRVTPKRLEDAARKMDGFIGEYAPKYRRLEEITQYLATVWTGEANTNFTNQINGFMPDFHKLEKDLREYHTFLEKAHQVYKQTEDSIRDNANRVVTRG